MVRPHGDVAHPAARYAACRRRNADARLRGARQDMLADMRRHAKMRHDMRAAAARKQTCDERRVRTLRMQQARKPASRYR